MVSFWAVVTECSDVEIPMAVVTECSDEEIPTVAVTECSDEEIPMDAVTWDGLAMHHLLHSNFHQ